MGFLKVNGKALSYKDSQQYQEYVKTHGIIQFLIVYNAHKDRFIESQDLHWGDEGEYSLISINNQTQETKLVVDAKYFIEKFEKQQQKQLKNGKKPIFDMQPEFGAWMIEIVPTNPYTFISGQSIVDLEYNIYQRRQEVTSFFNCYGLTLVSLASVPNLGVADHTMSKNDQERNKVQLPSELAEENVYSKSLFVRDDSANTHPRFPTLMHNIRERRQEKVSIKVPLFEDEKTDMNRQTETEPFKGQIYMDAMHFGMGCSCIQITFETQTLNHATYLHDQLLSWTPLFAALSASAPIYKGQISDIDMRWKVISQAVDCRTPQERDHQSEEYISKSRYSSINHYISDHEYSKSILDDSIKYDIDMNHYNTLIKEGLSEKLAYHISSLFVRDAMVIFDNSIYVDDEETTEHFENLQSTNWNSLRFKPPPSKTSDIGWRVEFRSMDIQISDFENSALTALTSLLVDVINKYDVNFLMPVTLIDENMERAHQRNAILEQKFYFRKNILGSQSYQTNNLKQSNWQKGNGEQQNDDVEEMTLAQIFLGSEQFKGLFPLILELMETEQYSDFHKKFIMRYLDMLTQRLEGSIMTGASYIRSIATTHPDYKQDSILTQSMTFDIIRACSMVGNNQIWDVQLLGEPWWETNKDKEFEQFIVCKSVQQHYGSYLDHTGRDSSNDLYF